jgi:hypothetical protein
MTYISSATLKSGLKPSTLARTTAGRNGAISIAPLITVCYGTQDSILMAFRKSASLACASRARLVPHLDVGAGLGSNADFLAVVILPCSPGSVRKPSTTRLAPGADTSFLVDGDSVGALYSVGSSTLDLHKILAARHPVPPDERTQLTSSPHWEALGTSVSRRYKQSLCFYEWAIRFLLVRPALHLRLPPDSQARTIPRPLAQRGPLPGP